MSRNTLRHQGEFMECAGIFTPGAPRVAACCEWVTMIRPGKFEVRERVSHWVALNGADREIVCCSQGGADFGAGVCNIEAVSTS